MIFLTRLWGALRPARTTAPPDDVIGESKAARARMDWGIQTRKREVEYVRREQQGIRRTIQSDFLDEELFGKRPT